MDESLKREEYLYLYFRGISACFTETKLYYSTRLNAINLDATADQKGLLIKNYIETWDVAQTPKLGNNT